MKRFSLTATMALSMVAAAAAASSACSSGDDVVTHGMGGGATTMGGSPAAPGSTMTTGGMTGTAGSSAAGMTGTAGTPAMGGMTGTAGTAGAAGGMGGAAGGMGGAAGGMGGAAPTGNCTGDCTSVFGKFDGWANLDPPASVSPPDGIQGPGAKDNVPTAVCANSENRPDHGVLLKEAHWQLKGPGIEKGAKYSVVVHVWGVVECKEYEQLAKCTRAANNGREASYDLWCPGATDPPLTSQPNHYNTVMLSVTPETSATTPNVGAQNLGPLPATDNWWMLNECPLGYTQSHKTWKIDFEKTIVVPGESWVNFVEFDTNCREILNCGKSDDAQNQCGDHYSLTPTGAVPAPPASITTQPAAFGANGYGQWHYFDVRSVTKM